MFKKNGNSALADALRAAVTAPTTSKEGHGFSRRMKNAIQRADERAERRRLEREFERSQRQTTTPVAGA